MIVALNGGGGGNGRESGAVRQCGRGTAAQVRYAAGESDSISNGFPQTQCHVTSSAILPRRQQDCLKALPAIVSTVRPMILSILSNVRAPRSPEVCPRPNAAPGREAHPACRLSCPG